MVVAQIDLPGADSPAAHRLLHLDPAEQPAAIGARVVGQIQAGLDRAAEKFGVGEPDPLDLLPIGLGGGVPATANDRRLQPIAALGIGIHFGRGNEADVGIVDERTLAIAEGSERSEEHTSELQSLMRTPYAVFCL